MSQAEMKISFDVRDKESLHREMPGKGRYGRTEQCRDSGEDCRGTTGTDGDIEYGRSGVRFREGMDMSATIICESLPDIERQRSREKIR